MRIRRQQRRDLGSALVDRTRDPPNALGDLLCRVAGEDATHRAQRVAVETVGALLVALAVERLGRTVRERLGALDPRDHFTEPEQDVLVASQAGNSASVHQKRERLRGKRCVWHRRSVADRGARAVAPPGRGSRRPPS